MSGKRILGFVVYCAEGIFHLALPFEDTCPENLARHGTLWFGHAGTIFKTKRTAQRAIARTKIYRDLFISKEGWPWIDRAQIFPVYRALA